MGIFGFRRKKKHSDGELRDAAFDASVAGLTIEPPVDAGEGTERRVITEEERDRFEELLVEHRLDLALLVALGYATRRAGSPLEAKHYVKRARARLWENCSWDPKTGPTLGVFLCGLVRSEMSSDLDKDERRQETEQKSLLEPSASADGIPDPEALLLAREEKLAEDRAAASDLDWLRREFEEKKDHVNLRWLELRARGVEDEPSEMARQSEFRAEEYYNAQKRRIRAVKRLLALKENG